jgi:hypothetical protein
MDRDEMSYLNREPSIDASLLTLSKAMWAFAITCRPLTLHIWIFSSETLSQLNWILEGSIYGRFSIKIAHFVPIINVDLEQELALQCRIYRQAFIVHCTCLTWTRNVDLEQELALQHTMYRHVSVHCTTCLTWATNVNLGQEFAYEVQWTGKSKCSYKYSVQWTLACRFYIVRQALVLSQHL